MEGKLFREKSLETISSPEELNDYMHVTSPSVWLILAAIILLLTGMLVWSAVASFDSFASGTAQVSNGNMHIYFDDEQIAENVDSGMKVTAGETETRVASVGKDDSGRIFAIAPTTLADGTYDVRVVFNQTQVLSLLFN